MISFSKKIFSEKFLSAYLFRNAIKPMKMYNVNEQKNHIKNTSNEFPYFFTDVIQMILVIIKHKEMGDKMIDITGELHNDK